MYLLLNYLQVSYISWTSDLVDFLPLKVKTAYKWPFGHLTSTFMTFIPNWPYDFLSFKKLPFCSWPFDLLRFAKFIFETLDLLPIYLLDFWPFAILPSSFQSFIHFTHLLLMNLGKCRSTAMDVIFSML